MGLGLLFRKAETIVSREEDMPKEFKQATDESKKAFGDDQVFIEKYLKGPKQVEVQVLADNYGNVVHLFDRDCSCLLYTSGRKPGAHLEHRQAVHTKDGGQR